MNFISYILGWFGYVKVGEGAVRVSESLLEYLHVLRPIVAEQMPDMSGHDTLVEFQQALVNFLRTGYDIGLTNHGTKTD